MVYKLNDCLLSPIFERSFGLPNFTKDYTTLLGELNAAVEGVNIFPYTSSPTTTEEETEYQDWRSDYRLFCKLCHFFDDFNFFIDKSLEVLAVKKIAPRAHSKHSVSRRLNDFKRRVSSMNIPQLIKNSICVFLDTQIKNHILQLSAAKEDEVPKRYPLENNLRQLHSEVLWQLSTTWKKFPELRLGQLIFQSLPQGTDISYVPNDRLIELLKNFEAQHGLP